MSKLDGAQKSMGNNIVLTKSNEQHVTQEIVTSKKIHCRKKNDIIGKKEKTL